ncbi:MULTISPECIES: tetratricopeptide repeat protein [unclassified Saccharothrix]|uniref:tetratricopeptide repeat protein n=1 Tax=unclassified Saccharothrix TaxID=2593673 RepID=UPI00307F7D1D
MIGSPGALLDPWHEVVPFHGRTAELAELARWRDAAVPRSVLLLHGRSGVGKTRLARQFAGVVVLDDADLLPWHDVQAVLREGPARVLLVARTAGWWWSATRQRAADLHYGSEDLELRPCPEDHGTSFVLACQRFADVLARPRPHVQAPPCETFYDLHLAALAAVHGDRADHPVDRVRRLISVDPNPPTTGRLAEDVLAVTLLDNRIAPAPDAVDTLLRAAERWPHVRDRAVELFTADPGLVAKAGTGPLRVLADHPEVVARQVFDDPRCHGDVLPALLTRALLRKAEDLPERAELNGLLSARAALAGLREEAVQASRAQVALYRQLVDRDPVEHRPALADALGDLSLRLVACEDPGEALAAAQESVAWCRLVRVDDPDGVGRLAAALDRLGLRYAAVGRRDEAAAAVTESAALFEDLARRDPTLFRLDAAKAVHHLAARLFDVGRRAEAGHATRRAVLQWRAVAGDDPRYEAEFARTLRSVAALLARHGRPTEAAAVVRESIGVLRRLAEVNPRDFEPALASALGDLGVLFRRLDRRSEAAQAFGDAVAAWRRVPGAAARLAGAWHRLADSAVTNEDARVGARMAVLLWHLTGHRDEVRHAETLSLYARRCAEAGADLDRALAAAHRAVELLRAARAEPERLARAEHAVELVVRAHTATRDLPSSS